MAETFHPPTDLAAGTDFASGRVAYVASDGRSLKGDADLTFDGTKLFIGVGSGSNKLNIENGAIQFTGNEAFSGGGNGIFGGDDSDRVSIAINGAMTAFVNGSGIRMQQGGSAAAPAYAWNLNDGLGFFRPGTDLLAVATASTECARFDAEGNLALLGHKRVSAQFDKTDTTLANVTGLSVNVAASGVYAFEAELFVDATAGGGSKYAIGGTATATAIVYQISLLDNSTDAYTINARQTALAGSSGQAGTTAGIAAIKGTITVNAAGTLTVQFAQNAASGTSSVLVGSTFRVQRLY
jgi:hypothetical protein